MKNLIFFLLSIPLFGFTQRDYTKMQINHAELTPGVHRLFVGDVVSVVAFDGPDGLMLFDAAYEQTVSHLRDTLKRMFNKPVRYLVNTHLHGDHTGGNVEFGKEADIIAHHSVKTWLASDRKQGERVPGPMPENGRPNITFEGTLNMEFNGQEIQMRHLEGGHTAGDVIAFLPQSNVLVLGDLLFADYFPYIDTGQGGNPMTFLKHLQWISGYYPDDAILVGGHGPVYNMSQLRNYINNLKETIEVVTAGKEKGMSVEQIKEEKILNKWESYGAFFITADKWIETVYPFIGQ
ncbi:MAG: MBL fold metallo-hydrolase [Bacteroidales bacterium]|nr:MBL fold metallo-hydrolase [Bacteroidales bacterium]